MKRMKSCGSENHNDCFFYTKDTRRGCNYESYCDFQLPRDSRTQGDWKPTYWVMQPTHGMPTHSKVCTCSNPTTVNSIICCDCGTIGATCCACGLPKITTTF